MSRLKGKKQFPGRHSDMHDINDMQAFFCFFFGNSLPIKEFAYRADMIYTTTIHER